MALSMGIEPVESGVKIISSKKFEKRKKKYMS